MTDSVARAAVYGLYGALRLARYDRSGIGYMETTPDGALRSFWSLVLVMPAYWAILLMPVDPQRAELIAGAGPGPYLLVETIGIAANLAGFLLAVHYVMTALGPAERVPRYIAAGNWASVVQILPFLLVRILMTAGLLAEGAAQLIEFLAFFWTVGIAWLLGRAALGLSAPGAAGLVLLELFIGNVVDAIALGIIIGA